VSGGTAAGATDEKSEAFLAELAHLEGLTKLEFLNPGNTQVTGAGVKELQRALPMLKISR
jgi:hypothetical protein